MTLCQVLTTRKIVAGCDRQASACRHKSVLISRERRGPGAPPARRRQCAKPCRPSLSTDTDTVGQPAKATDDRGRFRRRVTLIFGSYHSPPQQSTHDSVSSGGRAL